MWASALLLAAAGVQALPADRQARIEQWCGRSEYPTECTSVGGAAFSSGRALLDCRRGADEARKAGFVNRRVPSGHPTQAEYEQHCGDLIEACRANWRALYQRAAPGVSEEDLERRVEDDCPDRLPEIYVD
jgi:hypothetical protein